MGTMICPGIPVSPSPSLESWLMCTTAFIWTMWMDFAPMGPGLRGKEVCIPPILLLYGVQRHLGLDTQKELLGPAGYAIV